MCSQCNGEPEPGDSLTALCLLLRGSHKVVPDPRHLQRRQLEAVAAVCRSSVGQPSRHVGSSWNSHVPARRLRGVWADVPRMVRWQPWRTYNPVNRQGMVIFVVPLLAKTWQKHLSRKGDNMLDMTNIRQRDSHITNDAPIT